MKQWIVLFFTATFLFVATFPTTTEAIESTRTTTEAMKSWTITFNTDVMEESVSEKNIYIQDNAKKKIETILTVNGTSVTIKPKQIYKKNEPYTLILTKSVMSNKNLALTKEINMPFTYTGSTDAIEHIETSYSSIVTNVVVHASKNVFSIVVTSDKQHYTLKYSEGNVYSSGILHLSKGDTIIVNAYDAANKKVETKEVKVN